MLLRVCYAESIEPRLLCLQCLLCSLSGRRAARLQLPRTMSRVFLLSFLYMLPCTRSEVANEPRLTACLRVCVRVCVRIVSPPSCLCAGADSIPEVHGLEAHHSESSSAAPGRARCRDSAGRSTTATHSHCCHSYSSAASAFICSHNGWRWWGTSLGHQRG